MGIRLIFTTASSFVGNEVNDGISAEQERYVGAGNRNEENMTILSGPPFDENERTPN
jgi:hypothetical protein